MRLIENLPAHSTFGRLRNPMRNMHRVLRALLLVLAAGALSAAAQPISDTSAMGADPSEIVWMMVARNETRAQELQYFTALRHYHLDFHGLGRSMTADMHVRVTYVAESGKTFQIVDESGSRLLLDHVLKKLLQTEEEDSRQRKASLTPFNYKFTFDTETIEGGRRLYEFSVEPKSRNKLLYHGKIWIDAGDFAVVRVEAQPAENPSFWIKQTEIHHVYAKNGEFWLPETDRSESKVRLGGSAVLTIDYGTYQFEEPQDLAPADATELAVH